MKKFLTQIAILTSLANFPFSPSYAAEILKHPEPEMHCYLTVEGEIETGDLTKIKEAMRAFQDDHPDEWQYSYPSSMNSWKKICFNSSGGSFAEGVRIAQYLLGSHIGTAVPRNAQCLSACAVAFMGGTHDGRTDDGLFPWRQLHPLGTLGFHAPFIEVPERDYSGQVVQQAFEAALANMSQLLDQADEMHISRSLIIKMLNTPSDEMFKIQNIEKASQWGVTIAPVSAIEPLSPESVIYACYNKESNIQDRAIQIQVDGNHVQIRKHSDSWIGEIQGGFRQELADNCSITQYTATEHDHYSPLTPVGRHFIRENEIIYPYQMYDPLTPISSLESPNGQPAARVRSVEQRKSAQATCLVFNQNQISDKEPCRIEQVKVRRADFSVETVWNAHWPSGGKTVIDWSKPNHHGSVMLNGKVASLIPTDTYPKTLNVAFEQMKPSDDQAEDSWLWKDCWLNSETKNLFCIASFEIQILQNSEDSIR